MASRDYILISPCRDEAAYMQKTIDSIGAQTVLPKKWIIVDDGSTDASPEILAEAARKYPFIEVITRRDRGTRSVGPGVIEAFYVGYDSIRPDESYDYVCKIDVDLDIPATYFETMLQRMEANPRIGVCSGKPYFYGENGTLISEKCGDETAVGMIKFYRRACFEQIGGFVREVMWDTIDCHRCRMKGWIACSWDEPAIRFIHLRAMGSSHKSILAGRMRHGYGQYFMGTSLPYMTASSIYRLAHPPLIIGGLAMWWGFVRSMLAGKPRYSDREFRTFIRRYHWNCLFKGKTKATQELDQQQAPVWEENRLVFMSS